jgi:hypothetical protein
MPTFIGFLSRATPVEKLLASVTLGGLGSNPNVMIESDWFCPLTPKKSKNEIELWSDAYAISETFLQL